jgi:hypothetical protein
MVMSSGLYALSLEYRHHISVARISLRCKVGARRLQGSCYGVATLALPRLFLTPGALSWVLESRDQTQQTHRRQP